MNRLKLFITGSSGFVGTSISNKFKDDFEIHRFNRTNVDKIDLNSINCVIHLAGISKDSKSNFNSSFYHQANVELTKKVYNAFLNSNAKKFIYFSSVKACVDSSDEIITEETICLPVTEYGKSKLIAEDYIRSILIPEGKKVYILRPCMIHGPGNSGNLNSLYTLIKKGIPWPLGAFENQRSFCSIDNLLFLLNELITREDIPSGTYNIADDEYLSTNELISLIGETTNKPSKILNIPRIIFKIFGKFGDIFHFAFISEGLNKLSNSLIISNEKIKSVVGKKLPISTRDGILKTFQSFKNND